MRLGERLKKCSVDKKTWVPTAACSTKVLGKPANNRQRDTHDTYILHP